MGIGEDPPFLSEYTRKLIEQRCIALLFSHVGFKNANDDVLDALVDVLETFFKNICNDLRNAKNSALTGTKTGFPVSINSVMGKNLLQGEAEITLTFRKTLVGFHISSLYIWYRNVKYT